MRWALLAALLPTAGCAADAGRWWMAGLGLAFGLSFLPSLVMFSRRANTAQGPVAVEARNNTAVAFAFVVFFLFLAACDFTRLPENSAAQRAGYAVCNAIDDAGCGEHPWCFDALSGPCPWVRYITPPPPTPEPVCRERCRRREGESALCYDDTPLGRVWTVSHTRRFNDPEPPCVEWGEPLPCEVTP